MLDFDETPVDAVTPEALADAVTIRNRHVPIMLPHVHRIEGSEGVDGMDERIGKAEDEIVGKWGEAASWRSYLLCALLTRTDPLHHDIDADGTVRVDADLLRHAASTPLSDHPDEQLSWPAARRDV